MENKSLLFIVKSRYSTRQFTDEKIPDETIEKIIEIASYAPSSWGGHPVEFIIIRDKETLKKLGECKAKVQVHFYIVMLLLFQLLM